MFDSIMNLYESYHPIFVHFPIALLSIYAILECIHYKRIAAKPAFVTVKAVFLITGFIMGLVAAGAGPEGGSVHSWLGYSTYVQPTVRDIVEIHSTFAEFTLIVFGIIAFSYIVRLCNFEKSTFAKYWKYIRVLADFIAKPWILVILALVGLVLITITGGLGGSIVYGPNVDTVASYVFHLFFSTIIVR